MGSLCLGVIGADSTRVTDPQREYGTIMNGNDTARLEGYLHGESKYNILPVPAPINRIVASAFVMRELPKALDMDPAGKLARLAIFHDLRDTAAGFLRLLLLGETTPREVGRTIAAIAALAWIGDAPQLAAARQRYAELLRREDMETVREMLLDGAYALGPAEGSAGLRQAIARAVSGLQLKIRDLRAANQVDAAENLESRAARLEEFSVRELKALDRANALRQEILNETNAAVQINHLTALYLEEHPQGSRRLSEWAAFRLVRTSDRAKIWTAFFEASERNARKDAARQKELDLVHARALRAAAFFEAPITPEVRIWLGASRDDGTDLLALRPDWEYPPPHSH